MKKATIEPVSGILTEREIRGYLQKPFPERVVVTPLVDPEEQIRSNSIDLRLGCDFIVPQYGKVPYLDFAQQEELVEASLRAAHERVRVGIGEKYVLHPHDFVLGSTLEYVKLPEDLAGLVIGRSSWERTGLSIPTACISPGFHGCIALQLISHSHIPITLYPGVRICQLLLLPASSPVHDDSRYDLAVYPEPTRLHEDSEFRASTQGKFRLILGIVGTLVSGKSTLGEYLVGQHGFLYLTLSAFVHEEARQRGLPSTAAHLHDVGNSLRETHGPSILVHRLRSRMEALPGGNYLVVDGIKHVEEVRELRKWPNFALIGVDSPEEVRYQRALQRGRPSTPATEEGFRALDEQDRGVNEPPWGQQVDACIREADYLLDNSSSLDNLFKQLDDILAQLRKGR